MSKRAWSNESSRRGRIKPSSAELQRDKRITRVTRSASGRGFAVTGKQRYVDRLPAAGSWLPGKNRYMDRSPAAGSWLPENTGIWTDVGDYRKTSVIGHITGCGFAVTGHHRYLDRSMDSPRRYFLSILGFRRAGQREKKTHAL